MPDSAIATAADYADALLVARRAKNITALVLILLLLAQVTVFFLARYADMLPVGTVATSQPAPTTAPSGEALGGLALEHLAGIAHFAGVILSILLAMLVMLIAKIMLVGRLIGVGRVTSALVWSLLLALIIFPWQSVWGTTAPWALPSVFYTFADLQSSAKFPVDDVAFAVVKWFRFVGAPVVAILLIFTVQVKSNRGLRQALGEESINLPSAGLDNPR